MRCRSRLWPGLGLPKDCSGCKQECTCRDDGDAEGESCISRQIGARRGRRQHWVAQRKQDRHPKTMGTKTGEDSEKAQAAHSMEYQGQDAVEYQCGAHSGVRHLWPWSGTERREVDACKDGGSLELLTWKLLQSGQSRGS